ncbi:hypothetical protein ACROYT_G041140 [Oculina patagonica]
MGKTKTKTDKVRMKKSVRKPYSSLPSQQKQDGTTLVAEFERLVKEGLDEGQVNQSNQAQGSNVLVLQGLVMPKCPVDHSELVPYKATNSGERFFRCQKSQCGVICFENNLMDYSKAVAEKLHGSFKMAAPICLLDMTTLLNVSKSQKNYLLPYFTCGQRNKQDRCSYFQWADEKISNKNLQISNEAIKQRNEREAEIQAFLERQKQAVALPAGDDTGFGLSYDCLLKTIILPSEDTTFRQTFRQSLFSVDEFHYLRVSRVGTFTAYDDFDCILKCLRDPLCFSVNLAASKGADGKLWCELLPSDKYRNFTQYKGNKTSHHFAIMYPAGQGAPAQAALPVSQGIQPADELAAHGAQAAGGQVVQQVVGQKALPAAEHVAQEIQPAAAQVPQQAEGQSQHGEFEELVNTHWGWVGAIGKVAAGESSPKPML